MSAIGRFVWPGLLLVSVVVAGAGVLRWRSMGTAPGAPSYGDVVQAFTVRTKTGATISLQPGRWTFFAVAGPKEDGELIRYLQVLRDSGRFAAGTVELAAFARATQDEVRRFIEAHDVTVPVVPFHGHAATLRTALGLSDHGRRFLLIGPDMKVAFVADFMKKEDVRLLLEKHLPAAPAAPPNAGARALAAGDRFPPIRLRSLRRGGGPALTGSGPGIWIIFTSRCTSCSLGSSLVYFRAIERSLLAHAKRQRLGAALVFSRHFDSDQLTARLESLGLETPAYIAERELLGIEDPYLQQPYGGDDVVVVTTDPASRVRRIQSLPAWVNVLSSEEGG